MHRLFHHCPQRSRVTARLMRLPIHTPISSVFENKNWHRTRFPRTGAYESPRVCRNKQLPGRSSSEVQLCDHSRAIPLGRRRGRVDLGGGVASPFVRGRVRVTFRAIDALDADPSPQSSPLQPGERRHRAALQVGESRPIFIGRILPRRITMPDRSRQISLPRVPLPLSLRSPGPRQNAPAKTSLRSCSSHLRGAFVRRLTTWPS